MEGVGELFGKSVDAVLRRPRAALVPFAADLAMLALGTVLFLSIADVTLLFPQGYRLPRFEVAVPHALPTVGDVMGPTPDIHDLGSLAMLAAAVLILLAIPLLAYAEAGFLGVLRAVYVEEHDPLEEGRHRDAWSRIFQAFRDAGRRHLMPFLVLRGVQAALALAALVLPILLPRYGNYGLGVLAVDVLLLYAPYAVIEKGRDAWSAIRESVQLVSDHLATTLVALLFGFLVTGGVGLLVEPIRATLYPASAFLVSALYAPIGTTLSLFLYHVYLGFHPREALGEPVPARDAVAVGG